MTHSNSPEGGRQPKVTAPAGRVDRPDASALTDKRPWTLWLAVIMTGAEALELLAAAVTYVVMAVAPDTDAVPLLGLAAMFLLLAVGLAGVTIGLFRYGRWARPASVAWQLLLLFFAFNVGAGAGFMFYCTLIPAALALIGIFLPPSLRAYDSALKQQEAALALQREQDAAATDTEGH